MGARALVSLGKRLALFAHTREFLVRSPGFSRSGAPPPCPLACQSWPSLAKAGTPYQQLANAPPAPLCQPSGLDWPAERHGKTSRASALARANPRLMQPWASGLRRITCRPGCQPAPQRPELPLWEQGDGGVFQRATAHFLLPVESRQPGCRPAPRSSRPLRPDTREPHER